MQLGLTLAPAPDACGVAPDVHPALGLFHPLVQEWFAATLGEPTAPQVQGWPHLRTGEDVLISAPTGSGKTLTAFPVNCPPSPTRRRVTRVSPVPPNVHFR